MVWTEYEGGVKLIAMNNGPILYLGDDTPDGAAAYLAAVMTHFGLDYEHRCSDEPLDPGITDRLWSLVVLSDYPAANLSPAVMADLVEMVSQGTGLLMIGGWGSYQGLDGNYFGTPVGDILPVVLSDSDDRINSSGPCLITVRKSHPIVDGLPFKTDTPGIGGFNRLKVRNGGDVILESQTYRASEESSGFHRFVPADDKAPLLVLGSHGNGRVCAWASDVAPHWVGGLVDWGTGRVEARGKGDAGSVEVGNHYAAFFRNILEWTAGRR